MKRLVAFFGIALVLVGLRFYDTGLSRLFPQSDAMTATGNDFKTEIVLPTGADCYRIDFEGKENVDKLLKQVFAQIKFVEMDGKLIYAYSPRIFKTEWIHGQRVNLMIYCDGDSVCVGVPLLTGCY